MIVQLNRTADYFKQNLCCELREILMIIIRYKLIQDIYCDALSFESRFNQSYILNEEHFHLSIRFSFSYKCMN